MTIRTHPIKSVFDNHMKRNDGELIINVKGKYQNNPGFFDGVVDVINEFSICDFYQLYVFREHIVLFLRAYQFECAAVNEGGQLTTFIHPFQQRKDILLALYIIVQYLK